VPALREASASALPPGPRLHPSVQTLGWMTRPKPFLRRAHAKYGDVFTMRLQGDEFVVLAHPDAVKEVFTGDPDLLRAGEGNKILLPLLGKHSVLLLDGPRHLRQRKLMLPPFHGERMQRYRDIIVAATEQEVATWRAGEEVALAPRMQEITLEVITRAVFGVTDTAAVARLRTVLMGMLDWVQAPQHQFAFIVAMTKPELLDRMSSFKGVVRSVDETLFAEIRARRQVPDLAEREDILSMLLQARDEDGEGLSDEELRDELLTLLVAGHETTASALGWAFERLIRHPRALAHAVDDARGGDGEYLDAVAKETLRLRPILPMVARTVQEDTTIAGHHIPAGVTLAPCIYLVHHREDVYPEPDAFRPERFVGVKPGTYTWLPFGGGIRRCIGASFALFEMQEVMGAVLRGVDLRPLSREPEHTMRRSITLVPEHGARAVVSRAA
jgi:cytochrome P450 family 135